jgi:hypothetical protein
LDVVIVIDDEDLGLRCARTRKCVRSVAMPAAQTQNDTNQAPIATKRVLIEKSQPSSPPTSRCVETIKRRSSAHQQHEVQMKSMITTAALTGLLAIATVTGASAWERNGSVSGPRGTNTFNAQGSCSGDRDRRLRADGNTQRFRFVQRRHLLRQPHHDRSGRPLRQAQRQLLQVT